MGTGKVSLGSALPRKGSSSASALMLHGLSLPGYRHLQWLLETNIRGDLHGRDGKEAMTSYDVDMLRYLLAICTRQHQTGQNHSQTESQEEPRDERAAVIVDTAMRLVHICSTSEGVVQAVALQALKTWVEDFEMCVNICITQGNIVPTLLSTLHRSLPAATQAATAAYCASIAVILLRVFVRDGGIAGANAFLASKGVETLLELIDAVAHDERSLCLALYLLNDTTRRSMAVLEATVEAGAVQVVVGVLDRPNISEATKFAALILNRWSLAAHYQNLIQRSGASDALLGVLKAGATAISNPDQSSGGDNFDPYTSAYALSAFAMVNQGNIEEIQRVVLADKDALLAISFAIFHYEACFDGVGFPHLLMSQLIEGQAGVDILAELARTDLIQTWLKVKHVAVAVIERCIDQDVLDKLSAQLTRLLAGNASNEGLEEVENYVLSAIALLQDSLLPDFLPLLIPHGRLETLLSLFLRQVMEPDKTTDGKKALKEWQGVEDCNFGGLVSAGKRAKSSENISTLTCTPSFLPSPAIPRFCFRSLDAETSPRLPKEPVLLTSSPVATHSSNPKGTASSGSEAIAGLLRCCVSIAGLHRDRLQIAKTPSKTLSSLLQSPPADGSAAVGHSKGAGEVMEYVHINGRKRRRCQDGGAVGLEMEIEPSAGRLKSSDVGKKRYDSLCFVIGELETHAVGFVLENHSAVLHQLLAGIDNTSERVVIPVLPGFSCERMHQIFLLVVEWCYTSIVQCLEPAEQEGDKSGRDATTDLEKVMDLWKVADFLQMETLQCYCEELLEQRCLKRPEITVAACVRFATCNLSSRRLYSVVARYSLRRMLAVIEEDQASDQAGGACITKIQEAFLPVVVLEEKKDVLEALVEELAAEIREILVELQAALAGLQR